MATEKDTEKCLWVTRDWNWDGSGRVGPYCIWYCRRSQISYAEKSWNAGEVIPTVVVESPFGLKAMRPGPKAIWKIPLGVATPGVIL